jgi:serine/threonine protein kinase
MSETKEDGIKYWIPDIFFEKYPLNEQLSEGTYGIIFDSKDNNIVKFFRDGNLVELTKELNFYAAYPHPCIMKPVAWTVREGFGFLAMPRGMDVRTAFSKKEFLIEQLISDTLSAAAFLNSQGIAHCDYKPSNLIYHNKRIKLIDFGMARKASLGPDNEYYITGLAYTAPYIDPEYYLYQRNNIKCEIYALAMTYLEIVDPKSADFGALYTYKAKNPGLKWFIERASWLQEKRPSIQELLKYGPSTMIVRRHTGILFQEPEVIENKNCDFRLGDDMNWVVLFCYNNDFRAETLFLILHLLHRVYYPLLEEKEYSSLEKEKEERYLIITAAISLLGFILKDKIISGVDWVNNTIFKGKEDILAKHMQAKVNILRVSKGILITLTYWDYAKSKEDLLPLLRDTINCKYNPKGIRTVYSGSDKCISVKELISSSELEEFKVSKDMYLNSFTELEEPFRQGCHFNIKGDISEVTRLWNLEGLNINTNKELIEVILHNRKHLHLLDLDLALKIYRTLFNADNKLCDFILNTICIPSWKSEGYNIVTERIYPFKTLL